MEGTVPALGFHWEHLVLGPGNNTGLMRPEDQGAENEHMRAFFAATRRGPVETLLYQSAARRHDMLHEPLDVHARLSQILDVLSKGAAEARLTLEARAALGRLARRGG